jgi:pyruvate/2-oxoglutarate dehydrogenase complex dihydrolipoamide dehydrogenase (E3) component
MKVAVIERSAFGGTCVNTGCIPTKTMVASAYAARSRRSRRRDTAWTSARCVST